MKSARCTLIAIVLFFAAGTLTWIAVNRAPPQWDDAWYLTNSLRMFDSLVDGGLPGYVARYLTILRNKAPLITVLPTPVYLLLGRRIRAAYLVNLAAMLLLCGAVYAIGSRWRNAWTGVLAVYICCTMPLLYGLSHWFLVEYWLTAMVCLTVWLAFVALDQPSSLVLFGLGITCGLGLVLKISFPVYVLPVLMYTGVRLGRQSGWPRRRLWAFLVPAILLPLPWYAVNFVQAVGRAVFSGFSPTAARLYGSPLPTYLLTVVNAGLSGYYVVLSAVLLIWLAATRRLHDWWMRWSRDGFALVVLWMLPTLVFLMGSNQDVRLIAPVLPSAALLMASLLDRTKLAPLLLLFPLLAYLHASFGVLGNARLAAGDLIFAARELHFAAVYDRQSWPLQEILSELVHSSSLVAGETKTVMIGTDIEQFNANNFELAAVRNHLPLRIGTSAYENNWNTLLTQLHAADFFVFKDGGRTQNDGTNTLREPLIRAVAGSGAFREIGGSMLLPDGSRARIFRNAAAPANAP